MNGVGRPRADFTNMEFYRKALLVSTDSLKENPQFIQPSDIAVANQYCGFAVLVAQSDLLRMGVRFDQGIYCYLPPSINSFKDSSCGSLEQYRSYRCCRSYVLACLASGLRSNILLLGFCGSHEIRDLHAREDPGQNRVRLQLSDNRV